MQDILPNKITSVLFLTIIICFSLPFMAISCGEKTDSINAKQQNNERKADWIELTGYQVITGVAGEIMSGKVSKKERMFFFFTSFIIISFILAFIGFVLSFKKRYNTRNITIINAVGIVSLLISRTLWEKTLYGYYIVLVLFIAVTILNGYYYRNEKAKPINSTVL